jgi:hypothetical protein
MVWLSSFFHNVLRSLIPLLFTGARRACQYGGLSRLPFSLQFFVFVGRSFAASGAAKGLALPWIILSVISVAGQSFILGLRPT